MSENPFIKAIEAFEERGWYQGYYWDESEPIETAPVCSLGALRVAIWGSPLFNVDLDYPTHTTLWKAEDLLTREMKSFVPAFNDDAHTTYEDVVLAFKHAAEKWEAVQ